MSCWTSLTFYRPTSPPQVTGTKLGAFVREFTRLEVANPVADGDTTIKFGDAIDQDDHPSDWEEEIAPGSLISTIRSLDWDITIKSGPLIDTASLLDGLDGRVYRAHIPLGGLVPDLTQRFTRSPSPEETRGLSLFDCSLSIGPVLLADLSSESDFFGGWISISLGGDGQIWPWTTHELVRKAEGSLAVRSLMDLCVQTWPVPSVQPTGKVKAFRKEMGNLWPYMDRDRPMGWAWSVCEG